MPSELSFKEKVAKFRRELESFSETDALLRTLKEMQSYEESFPADSNKKICAAHLGKELVDWIAQKQDDILGTEPGKTLMALLERFLDVCHTAPGAIRSFCVARLYNAVITLKAKNSQALRLLVCGMMIQFPIEDEQVDLFDRLKRVVLKTVQDWSSKGVSGNCQEEGIDLVIELQRKLLVHAAGKPPNSNGTRTAALTLFREMFDTSLALLYRVFTICRPKAHQLYRTVMETMETVVRPDEAELISLLSDCVGFIETIISFSGDGGKEYLQFTKMLSIFTGISREPYASCYHLLHQQLRLQQQTNPTGRDIGKLTSRLRTLHAEHVSNPLVVKVAIFLTCQASAYFNRLLQNANLTVANSRDAIDFFQSLMPFVRHCPGVTVPELCRMCTRSRLHLAERLITIIVQLCIFQVKLAVDRKATGAQESTYYPVDRVCELIAKKLSLLDQLGCDRKRALIDNTVRQSVMWVKYTLTLLRDDPKGAEDAMDVLKVLKLLVTTQNCHRFEFLNNLHLVRLLENCYIERPDCSPAQTSAFCWGSVSVRMIKLLLTLRESVGPANEEDQPAGTINPIVRSIMFNQINAPDGDPIRSLGTVQLYQHASFDRHGFAIDCVPTREEAFMIVAQEMSLAVKYRTPLSRTPLDYFLELQKLGDLRENCLTFGMALFGFIDEAEKIPTETMEELCTILAAYEPKNIQERIKRFASMAIASYHSFSLLSRTALNRVREVPFKTEHFRNDQIDGLLVESQLDRETQLIDLMEAIRRHCGEMIGTLAEDSFQSLGVLPSVAQIASILENIAKYYQLNYYPHRAVDLQLQNLLIVSQGREERPLEQFAPLAFLLEHPRVTEELLDRFPAGSTACWQTYAATKLGPLEKLAERAIKLIELFANPSESFVNNVPENRKFQFLSLYLGLAIYYASREELSRSLEVIRRVLALLPPTESQASGEGKDGANPPSAMETIGLLVKGRIAQIIFRLVVEYGLPWPGTDGGVPPVSSFLKSMLTSFNDLQKLPNKHTFVVSLATVELTVAVLQYLIIRYDTGALIEPYVDQLLKFVLRRGAGLRVMQVLLLYGHMNADMQKLDRCKLAIRYVYRVLMLRPIQARSPRKEGVKIIDETRLLNDRRHRVPLVSPVGMDNDCDGERKAVPKHLESATTRTASDSESAEPTIEQYLMFRHSPSCDCPYCRYPQYKCMAFQAAALSARLSALKRSSVTKRAEQAYQTIVDHWLTAMEPALDRSAAWFGAGYLEDFVTALIRMFVQWGQFLGMLKCFDPALMACDRALQLSKKLGLQVSIDPALLEDVIFQRTALGIAQKRWCQPLRQKRSRSMIETHFQQAVAKGRITAGELQSPTVGDIVSLSMELNNLLVTPKQHPSSAPGGKGRAPPKTVDRVNELVRQAANRRHQLAKNTGDEPMLSATAAIPNRSYSASARKPKTVSIFVDSPPGAAPAGSTVRKLRVPLSSAKGTAPAQRITKVDLCEDESSTGSIPSMPTPVGGLAGLAEKRRRAGGKRALLQEDLSTPAKSSTNTYKDALVKSPLVGNLEKNGQTKDVKGKVRRFEKTDFPSLSAASDPVYPAPKTPQRMPATQGNGEFASPGLNGSFRDALVLGVATKNDCSVIVLDDSADSPPPEEAVEASFVDNATMSTGKNSVLSLKSYSDRKRLLQGSGSRLTPSTQSAVSAKRRTPFLATKTKLRFDDPSPEQREDDQPAPKTPVQRETPAGKKTPQKVVDPVMSMGFVSARKTTRKRTCQLTNDDESVTAERNIPPSNTGTGEDNIATRTRQRRKRI
uniref:Uncharacterized protein n=1 Tax=Anopheles atroparvus TaxID=41427 RepID=A0AAG5CXI5_ANOAO